MNALVRYAFAAPLFCLGFGTTGCGDDGENGVPLFETTLSVQDGSGQAATTFTTGQPISFVLSVKNLTDAPQTITLPTGQGLDVLVLQANQTTVHWRWSYGQGFTQAITYLNFTPGETKTFPVVWGQKDNGGAQVNPGDFEAQGHVATSEEMQKTFNANYAASETRSMMMPFVIQ